MREGELELMAEVEELKKLGGEHKHIVRLLGYCCSTDGPFYAIYEYAALGSLHDYLQKCRTLSIDAVDPGQIHSGNLYFIHYWTESI